MRKMYPFCTKGYTVPTWASCKTAYLVYITGGVYETYIKQILGILT